MREQVHVEKEPRLSEASALLQQAEADCCAVREEANAHRKRFGSHAMCIAIRRTLTRQLARAFRSLKDAAADGGARMLLRESVRAHGTQLLFRVIAHAAHKRLACAWRVLSGEATVAKAVRRVHSEYREQLQRQVSECADKIQQATSTSIRAAEQHAELLIRASDHGRNIADMETDRLKHKIRGWLKQKQNKF